MILFDQLRISDDGQTLYIDAHVNKASYFENVYIEKVVVCTEGQVMETNPQEFTDDYVYKYEPGDTTTKEVHLVLNASTLNEKFTGSSLSGNMFFVYVKCEGIVPSDTPCRLDEMTTLGVTFDYGAIFNGAMNYTRELADSCEVPDQFIDFILNFEALKLAIETEHYIPAIKYWKYLLGHKKYGTSGTAKPCGCHG